MTIIKDNEIEVQPVPSEEEINKVIKEKNIKYRDDAIHEINKPWKVNWVLTHIDGIDINEAKRLVEAIHLYTRNGHEFKLMREKDTKYSSYLDVIDRNLVRLPKFDGLLVRGIAVRKEHINSSWYKGYITEGLKIKQEHHSSWTYSKEIGENYAAKNSAVEILLLYNNIPIGVLISPLSNREEEKEILIDKKYNIIIRSIKKFELENKVRYNIEVGFTE